MHVSVDLVRIKLTKVSVEGNCSFIFGQHCWYAVKCLDWLALLLGMITVAEKTFLSTEGTCHSAADGKLTHKIQKHLCGGSLSVTNT